MDGAGKVRRFNEVLGVLVLVFLMVVPVLPRRCAGTLPERVKEWERSVSVVQGWQMYAPGPQKSVSYMNLEAVFDDGSRRELEETEAERQAWGRHFAWTQTRMDIWRQYALFSPKKANRDRTWYLRGVCVREARRGKIPTKIVMTRVRRRITPPGKVRAGLPGLGRRVASRVASQSCTIRDLREMIAADRALNVWSEHR